MRYGPFCVIGVGVEAGLMHGSALAHAMSEVRAAVAVGKDRRKMAGKTDKVKGRIKEAAGALANDKSLKREGRIDQAVGAVKDAVESAVDAVKDTLTGRKRKRTARASR